TAKIFPATSSKKDTRVFRFYCELEEEVEVKYLQSALEITLEKYPLFLSVLRRGLFWFYLEKNEYAPIVKQERKAPCSKIYSYDELKYLFRVNYYQKRINFEVYHVLTDGTGATQFLKELVKNYLYMKYQDQGLENISLTSDDLTAKDVETDSFSKFYDEETPKRVRRNKRAHQIHGFRMEENRLQIFEGVLSVQAVLEKARYYKVSMTVYLTAVFLCAIHKEMNLRQEKRPVILMVPVNLRKFFPSESMLNFFGWIDPGFQFGSEDDSFETVLMHVKEYFAEELTQDRMAKRMNEYTRLENHPILRFAPLEIKNLAIQAGVMYTERDITAVFSNMSAVSMPKEYEGYIHQFGVLTSTPKVELCMCSFKDRLVLNFTSLMDTSNIQRNFFRILSEQGVQADMRKDQFPEPDETDKQGTKFNQWMAFSCILVAVIAVMLNVLVTPQNYWSVFAIGGAFSMWLAVTTAYRKRKNLLKNAIWQMILISLGCIIWDLVTGWHGWSVDIMIPSCTLLTLVFMLCFVKMQKLLYQEYLIYYIMAAVYGMVVPLILLLTGVVTIRVVSVCCVGICFLFLASLVIFKKQILVAELQKKLHY
ncbi:MAG: DUF6320 domain-containing protein, partial [Lachnospiraceae bacterium]